MVDLQNCKPHFHTAAASCNRGSTLATVKNSQCFVLIQTLIKIVFLSYPVFFSQKHSWWFCTWSICLNSRPSQWSLHQNKSLRYPVIALSLPIISFQNTHWVCCIYTGSIFWEKKTTLSDSNKKWWRLRHNNLGLENKCQKFWWCYHPLIITEHPHPPTMSMTVSASTVSSIIPPF